MVFMPQAFSTPVTAHVVLFVMILQSLFVPWVLIFSFPDVLVGNIVILLEFIQLKKMRTQALASFFNTGYLYCVLGRVQAN